MNTLDFTDNFLRRAVWAEVDLDAAQGNIAALKKHVGDKVEIMAVVKANAYGHGAIEVAKAFLEGGATRLAVAFLDEALELREAGFSVPLFVLGHTDGRRYEAIINNDITVGIYRYADAELLSSGAVSLGKTVKIHIAIDTGMGRIGYQPNEAALDEIVKIADLPNIELEGIYTHFCVADAGDKTFTHEQFRRFDTFIKSLEARGVKFQLKHCANSATILDLKDYHLDMVRPGIVQYGYDPSDEVPVGDHDIRPMMSLHACISNVKTIDAGDTVSYGRNFTATKPTVIATLPLGYSDGYPRSLSGKFEVIIHGKRVPQVGNVCMDQLMVDVTSIVDNEGTNAVKVGDEAVLFGSQGEATISVEEIATKAGTIPHEITCNINRRVPRIYIKDKQIFKRLEYLQQK